MQQSRVISCLTSLALVMLLLFAAAWRYDGLIQQKPSKKATEVVRQANLSQVQDALSSEDQLNAISGEAIFVPASKAGGGSNSVTLRLLAPIFLMLLLLRLLRLRQFPLPHYYFAYLRHLFGHVIAPNAP